MYLLLFFKAIANEDNGAVYQEETYWARGMYWESDDQKGFEHV